MYYSLTETGSRKAYQVSEGLGDGTVDQISMLGSLLTILVDRPMTEDELAHEFRGREILQVPKTLQTALAKGFIEKK